MDFAPSVYEHAAFLLCRTPWEVSRDGDLFYQAHVDGKFRLADTVVHEDSKDAFFVADKNQYKSFYKYNWKTRYSTSWKGTGRNDHSTRVVGNRVARQIRNAPRNKPVFAVASVYSGHTPNIAFLEHVGSAKCAGIKPWSGGAYNEKDVSDKPTYIRFPPTISCFRRIRSPQPQATSAGMASLRASLPTLTLPSGR